MKKENLGRLAATVAVVFIWSLISPVFAITTGLKVSFIAPKEGDALASERIKVEALLSGGGAVSVDFLVNGALVERTQLSTDEASDARISFYWDTSRLAAGRYFLSLVARGEEDAQASARIAVDLTGEREAAMTPRIQYPEDGAEVSGKVKILMQANPESGSNVVLLVDGRLRAITNVYPYNILLDTSSLSEGVHTLQMQIYGPGGEVISSRVSTIYVVDKSAQKAAAASNETKPVAREPVVSRAERGAGAAPSRDERLRVASQIDEPRAAAQAISLREEPVVATAGEEAPRQIAAGTAGGRPTKWRMEMTAARKRGAQETQAAGELSAASRDYARLPKTESRPTRARHLPRLADQAISSASPALSPEAREATAPPAEEPAVTAATPRPQYTGIFQYTVVKGDCLWSLARRFGTTVETIVEANGIADASKIQIGQRLWIQAVPTLSVDGEEIQMQPGPFFSEGRLMVPLRALVEALGGNVGWEAQSEKVSFNLSGSRVSFTIGDTRVLANDRVLQLERPTVLREGRSFMPFEVLREVAALPARFELEENRIEIARLPR